MANKQFNTAKFIKTFLVVFSILVAGVLLLGWFLNRHWNALLKKELPGYVAKISDSLYIVQFRDLRLDVLSGSVTVEKVHMLPDTLVFKRLKARNKAPQNVYNIEVEKLELRYFKLWKYFMGKKLSAGELVVTGPKLEYEQNLTTVDTSAPKTAYEQISNTIGSIYIGRLVLDSTAVKYVFVKKDSSRVIHQFDNLNVRINNLLIDSVALKDPTRFLYAKNYEIAMKDYAQRTKDSLYNILVKGIRYDAAERTFHVGHFQVQPRYARDQFQKVNGTQKDLFDVAFNNISIQDLNPMLLLQEQQIWASKLQIQSGKLNIYRDRSLPLPPGDKLGNSPQQLLEKVKIPIMIDTLVGNNVDIQYSEKNPETQHTGVIHFRNVHGVFTNLTNIDSLIAKNNHLVARLDAIFMQSGKLMAKFDFLMKDKTARFTVTGRLNSMNGKDLNVVTKPLGKVEIKSCNLQELDFSINGDQRKASGYVKLLYQNLKISVLKQDKDHGEYKRKGLISFLANVMVIKDSNPLPGENVRTANVTHTRDIKKSFFNLVWKTLFDGVKDIVGAGGL